MRFVSVEDLFSAIESKSDGETGKVDIESKTEQIIQVYDLVTDQEYNEAVS